jgi:hypothetical protein
MNDHSLANRLWWRDFFLLSFGVVYPSIAIFKKVGMAPLCLYVLLATGGLFLWLRYVLPWFRRVSPRWLGPSLFLAGFLLVSLAVWRLNPVLLRDHGFRWFGISFGVSDSNDAFMATWKAMFEGKYPYYAQSFLGNPISPMPGALMVALPFYLLGNTIYQNLFWLLSLWVLLAASTRDYRLASWMMLTVFAFSPGVIYSLIQGMDYLTNNVYVLLPILGLFYALNTGRRRYALIAATFLGLALSSRANYLLLAPMLVLGMVKQSGLKNAIAFSLCCLAVFVLVTLPFYLYDPSHFSPLHTAGKLNLNGKFPHAATWVFVMGCLLSSGIGLFPKGFDAMADICRRCFYIQMFVLLAGFALASAAVGKPNLEYPSFGLLNLGFGLFAFGPRLFAAAGNPGHALPGHG